MRLAVHATALPVTLDDDAGNEPAVHLVTPAPVRVAVEAVRHRRSICRSRDGCSHASAKEKRSSDGGRTPLQVIPEHQDSFVLERSKTSRVDRNDTHAMLFIYAWFLWGHVSVIAERPHCMTFKIISP